MIFLWKGVTQKAEQIQEPSKKFPSVYLTSVKRSIIHLLYYTLNEVSATQSIIHCVSAAEFGFREGP